MKSCLSDIRVFLVFVFITGISVSCEREPAREEEVPIEYVKYSENVEYGDDVYTDILGAVAVVESSKTSGAFDREIEGYYYMAEDTVGDIVYLYVDSDEQKSFESELNNINEPYRVYGAVVKGPGVSSYNSIPTIGISDIMDSRNGEEQFAEDNEDTKDDAEEIQLEKIIKEELANAKVVSIFSNPQTTRVREVEGEQSMEGYLIAAAAVIGLLAVSIQMKSIDAKDSEKLRKRAEMFKELEVNQKN